MLKCIHITLSLKLFFAYIINVKYAKNNFKLRVSKLQQLSKAWRDGTSSHITLSFPKTFFIAF